jgi:bloom syndrome protein
MDRLYRTPAHRGIKVLYITPEKLSRSESIKSHFKKLSDRGCISRFVVDNSLAFEHSLQDIAHTLRIFVYLFFCP